jgi:hypothetical protein
MMSAQSSPQSLTQASAQFPSLSTSHYQTRTPVVFVIFKRPDTTQRVFEAIRQAKPRTLFVIADAPRPQRLGEAEKCAATKAVLDGVDWDCQVIKRYAETNLGCAQSVAGGLDWVFSQVEEAIILEDDCLPHPSFFRFCDELLERYRHDDRIASISGQNVQFGQKRGSYSYYFSHYNHIWGWATWRRAWRHFDAEMALWPEVKAEGLLRDILNDPEAVRYWMRELDTIYTDLDLRHRNWSFKWTLSCWCQNGLGIIPNVNLISNIGFDAEGTTIQSARGKFAEQYSNAPTAAVDFPLRHPAFVVRDLKADDFTQRTLFRRGRLQGLKQAVKQSWQTLGGHVGGAGGGMG